eukprot:10272593-Alexandrium_andersonii.AAC.1
MAVPEDDDDDLLDCVNFLAGTCDNQQCTYARGLTELRPRRGESTRGGGGSSKYSEKQESIGMQLNPLA